MSGIQEVEGLRSMQDRNIHDIRHQLCKVEFSLSIIEAKCLICAKHSARHKRQMMKQSQSLSHFHHYPQANWALLVLIPGWVGLCTFQDPVGLSNELSYEVGSFSCHFNPHRFLHSEVLRLYFPTLEPGVVQSVLIPSCSSQFICTQMWDCQLPPCHMSSPPWLPISAPPSSLNECFFFNSLVVRLPYSLIFWQFWMVFKLVVFLLLV